MPTFVKIERGKVDKEVFDRHVPAHVEYVRALNDRGHRARSGYWVGREGGMMLFDAVDKQEARRILEQDPLILNGCVDYELHEWRVVIG